MKRKLRLLFPLIIGAISLGGCDFIKIEDAEDTSYKQDSKALKAYYKETNLELSGGRLENELQKMCFTKHVNWVTYGQVNSYYTKTATHESVEAIAKGSKTNQWFYTGKEAAGTGTREHVFPCANSGDLWNHDNKEQNVHNVDLSTYIGGGSDLLHVRTCNSAVNTARGNSKFVDFDDDEFESKRNGVEEIGENNGKWTLKIQGHSTTGGGAKQYAQLAEPADEMKGDIARIVLYVYIHYADRGLTFEGSKTSGNLTYNYSDMVSSKLSLTNIIGYDSLEKCKEVLKAWNKLDPPSKVEYVRNDAVQKIQGNRNPFVDYPDLVDKIFNS